MPSSTANQSFAGLLNGDLTFSGISVTEIDNAPTLSDVISFINASALTPITSGFSPTYAGIQWGSFLAGVKGDPSGNVTQILNFNYTVSAGPGGAILGYSALVIPNTVTGPAGEVGLTATEVLTGATGNPLGSLSWAYTTSSSTSSAGSLTSAASQVNVALSVTADVNGAGDPNAGGYVVAYSAIQQGFIAGSVTIDKQVSVDGGNSWQDVGNGTITPNEDSMVGCTVEYRSIITNTSTTGVTLTNASVSDVGGPGFTFGGSSTFSLASGASITSDVSSTVALAGTYLDTATVTGTVSAGTTTATVTASDTAEYIGLAGSVTIDKQVSTDGTTWYDVGNGVLAGPTAVAGGIVDYRVLITNTGSLAINNAVVSDISPTASAFNFGFSGSTTVTLGVGQTLTSDITGVTAVSGHNLDTATVTGTVSVGNMTCVVTANDTADYTGIVTHTPTGTVSIDKQVFMCGTWQDVGKVLNNPTFSIGSAVDFRVVVTDTGGTVLDNLSVADVNGGTITGFTFGGVATVATLGVGASITSDIAATPALAGHYLDTATVTGFVGIGGPTVTASDTADYTGTKGSITIDKQVSLNGCTWTDVGIGVLGGPTATVGSTIYYRVIVTDTGSGSIGSIKVTDVGPGAPTFTFGCGSGSVSLCAGQSITSNTACSTVQSGYITDTATVTGTVGSGCGGGYSVSACDVADYTGTTPPATGALDVFVLNDCNGDGIGDNGETGFAGVTVALLNGSGVATGQTATTNSSGIAAFNNLMVGNYEVAVTTPSGYVVTKAISINTPIAVTSGATAWAAEALYHPPTVCPGALSVYILNDTNGDGLGDCGETGLAGVKVALLNGSGVATGQTATTNSSGIATFGNLAPGTYEVAVTTPAGDVVTKANSINTPITVTSGNTAWASEALYSPPPNLCQQYGQAQKFEFCYKPSDCVSSSCLSQGLGSCSGHDGYSNAFIEISNCANPYASGAKVYFEGTCSSGQNIYADCTHVSGGCFDSTTYISVFSSQSAFQSHQSAVQECSYVTGGSLANCNLGDQVGCVSVVGYVGSHGAHCV